MILNDLQFCVYAVAHAAKSNRVILDASGAEKLELGKVCKGSGRVDVCVRMHATCICGWVGLRAVHK